MRDVIAFITRVLSAWRRAPVALPEAAPLDSPADAAERTTSTPPEPVMESETRADADWVRVAAGEICAPIDVEVASSTELIER